MKVALRYLRIALLAIGVIGLVALAGILLSLTLPVQVWRTGQVPTVSIPVEPAQPFSSSPTRVWIDTDAACGHGPRVDPDDCLAILLLARQESVDIVGISTVFGNAPLDETHRTTNVLADQLRTDERLSVPLYRGSSMPLIHDTSLGAAPGADAHEFLREALQREPLTLVALGPLTNIALALQNHPGLQANVVRLVTVMGRRRGHVFHPVEGGTAGSFFGHGPVFRDFNFAADEEAAVAVMGMKLPMTLVPYQAARRIMLDTPVLDKMKNSGGAAAWVAERAGSWLSYWRKDIGRDGFYPFDLVAAAYVAEPSLLGCAEVMIAVENDTWLLGWFGFRGLFALSNEESVSHPFVTRSALYCPEASQDLGPWLIHQLTGS
jgi:inosine-uridine nucleoside N-ribohydrolase